MSIKLAIADDHTLILDSLSKAFALTGYIEVCGKYLSGDELMEGLKTNTPDVLLLDYHFPEHNGSQLTKYVTYHYPDVGIIILTGYDKPGLAAEMLEYGCMGYLLKSSVTTEVIIEAVERVANGQIYMDGAIRKKFASNLRRKPEETEHQKFTQRELEILKEIASSLSSQQIADKLYISKRTVDNHRTSIMMKSGMKNTAGLIKYAIELKLV
jgi:DNA-binding NarL/FixJ family response regulator